MSDREWHGFNDKNREGISNLANSYDTFASGVQYIDELGRSGWIQHPSYTRYGVTFHDAARGIGAVSRPVAIFDAGYDLGTYSGPSRVNRTVGIGADYAAGAAASGLGAGLVIGAAAVAGATPPGWAVGLVAVAAGAGYTWGLSDTVRNGVTAKLDEQLYRGPVYSYSSVHVSYADINEGGSVWAAKQNEIADAVRAIELKQQRQASATAL